MKAFLLILARTAGGSIGLLVGGVMLFWAACAVISGTTNGNEYAALYAVILLGPLGFLAGAPLGAAVGANVTGRILRQRTSLWKALLGAVTGLVVGVLPTALCLWTSHRLGAWQHGWWPFFLAIALVCVTIVAGAVLGSGWKTKPAKATGSSS